MLNVISNSDFQIESGMYAVKFWATWCGPCHKMAPTIAQLETEFTKIEFISVDVDEAPEPAQKYQVKSLPTLLLFKDGKEINRMTGLSLIEPLRKMLRDLDT